MKIIFQDDYIIICIKPAGVLSTDEPYGMPWLIRQNIGEDKTVRTVHRLDSVVSGLMVYALTKEAASGLSNQINYGSFTKEYLAVTEGMPAVKSAELRDYLQRNTKERKTYAFASPSHGSEEAILRYKVCSECEGMSLLKVHLVTGRTHQIRAQFSSRKLPLYGDRKYGSRNESKIALWSYHLNFAHPVTGANMDFIAYPPAHIPWNIFPAEFYAEYDYDDIVMEIKRPDDYGDCRYADICQGCSYQGMSYKKNLEKKSKLAAKFLKNYCPISPVTNSDKKLGYRHKSVYSFYVDKDGKIQWESSQRTIKPVTIRRCILDSERSDSIAGSICNLAEKYSIPVFNKKTSSGLLRYAVVRTSTYTNETMLTIVSSDKGQELSRNFIKDLLSKHPEIKTVVLNVNKSSSNSVFGKEESLLNGPGYIDNTLMGYTYRIGSRSFFPSNPAMSEKIYSTAIQFADLTGEERVLDAGCGNGLISIPAASNARRVLSVERNEETLKELRTNLTLNNITNVKAVSNDPAEYITSLVRSHEMFDVVFVDSTRSISFSDYLTPIGKLGPKRIVLISGDIEKLAGDIHVLGRFGYKTEKLQSFDSQPYTSFVDTVVLMTK